MNPRRHGGWGRYQEKPSIDAAGANRRAAPSFKSKAPKRKPGLRMPRSGRRGGGRRTGDLFLQLEAGLADLGRHQRTVLDLKEDAPGLFAVAPCRFLHLVGRDHRVAGHRLALLDAVDQFRPHRLDVLGRGLVFANHGFGRQLADLGGAVAMLDIVRDLQRFLRRQRGPQPGRRVGERARIANRWPVSNLRLDLALQVYDVEHLSVCWLNHTVTPRLLLARPLTTLPDRNLARWFGRRLS